MNLWQNMKKADNSKINYKKDIEISANGLSGDCVVYILECADDSLYTGWTDNLDKRVKLHNSGRGAKYTRSRLPIKLVYAQTVADKSEALRREYAIKKLARKQKLELICSDTNILK